MVTIKTKFHAHGKKGKWFTKEVRTMKEARETKRFVGKEGIVKIIPHRKITKRRTGGFPGMGGFRMPRF